MNIKKPVDQPERSTGHAAGHLWGYFTLIHNVVMSEMCEPPYGWLC